MKKVADEIEKELNANEIDAAILNVLRTPYEILNGSEVEDKNLQIFDPLKVTTTSLQNATSVVKTVLSTGAVVLNRAEWNMN